MAAVKRGVLDGYKTYDVQAEGYGSAQAWRGAFSQRMGINEAEVIIKGQKRTPFQILGLAFGNHTQEAIKQAFRKKAMQLHPDRALQNGMTIQQATEAFKELMAAYTLLKRVV